MPNPFRWLADMAPPLRKYSPDQERDESGRFGAGGGSGGSASDVPAKDLIDRAMKGGFTFKPMAGFPSTGYVVSLPGYEEVFDAESFTEGKLISYLEAHKDELAKARSHLGGWKMTGSDGKERIVMDISEVVDSGDEARRLGVERKQAGIFDLEKGEYIELGADAGRVGSVETKAKKPERFMFPKGATAAEIIAAINGQK